ncbi:MAG: hypothetical protein QOJ27_2075 [Sphingomonadales bacterium]|jgi:hypothetical protein|nr:hypothetical protein [Sphingomonadales bacterium]
MDKQPKELIAGADVGHHKVFVRSSPRELTMSDLDVVAGGRRDLIVPNG